MATTYGYGGEFSSDEDVDKLEQMQNERMVQSKFEGNSRPSKKQIEDLIDTIKKMPIDQEVNLSDDMLAGLLDYFKTQRGPIVESTRKLYHKIALRLVRGDQQSQVVDANNVASKDTNGKSMSNNNVIQDNNNSINLESKVPQQKADTFSSDEDDEVSFLQRRTVQQTENDNKMEVDSVTPTGPPRVTKQVDMSTTDDDESTSESSNAETSELEELNSESDVMDVTPIKPPVDQQRANKEKESVEAVLASARATPRQPEYSAKRHPLAQSTPKDGPDLAKKPYTRSQRVATRSATRGKATQESLAKNLIETSVSSDAFIKKQDSSKKYVLIAASLFVVVLAFLLFYFRSSISKSTVPFLTPKIKF